MTKFNVLVWGINSRRLETYDVLPYFRREYSALNKKDRPHTREQWETFIRSRGMYKYWSRCEYEIIVSPWPPEEIRDSEGKKTGERVEKKIDVWQQIENNLDLIVDILIKEFNNE